MASTENLKMQRWISTEAPLDTAPAAASHTTIVSLPFSGTFFEKTPEATAARKLYLRTVAGGVFAISVAIFAFFPIYWGAMWSTPHHTLPGWIVDFDGGMIGQVVSNALGSINPGVNGVAWEVVSPSQFPGGVSQLENEILREKVWYAVAINAGASANLTAAVATPDVSYNSSSAITFLGSEARNENIYRLHSRIVSAELDAITHAFALQFIKNVSSSANFASVASTAPELVSRPVYFSAVNLRPFDVPVASAVTFVGLIYLLILSFFIVMVSAAAREDSGLETRLSLASLIKLRLSTSFVAYFFVSLFYTLLSRAFQLPFSRAFGAGGLPLFWMLNYAGMLACGLALDAMITLLTQRFVSFFLILWIISNVAACVFPLQVLPRVYGYGYAFPFYNISRSVRAIVFRTKNDVGMNFGVLIAWIALSCITIPLFQWFVRRRQARAAQGKLTQI